MPLSWRLYLGLAVVVTATAALAFLTTGRGVLGPLNERVFDAFLDQAVYVAEQVEGGVPPDVAGQRMGLDVHLRRRHVDEPRRGRGGRHGAIEVERKGRAVRYHDGPRNRVQVRTDAGWVVVRRDLDLERPRRTLIGLLVGCAVLVGIAGTWVVRASLRPLDTAIQAMRRVADGDLAHRIPEDGPRELREVAAAFHRMTERLDALTRADRQLVAGVSHEIRTPLSRIRLRLELLEDEIGEHRRIGDLNADLAEIDRLVGELVTLSRLQLGGFRIERGPAHTRSLVEEALGTSSLEAGRVRVVGEGAEVQVDRDLAVRAIANVLQNAHRYAPEGEVEVALDGARVTVRDRGPGIDEAVLASIFDPFVRGTTPSPSGLGLGLMIVKQVTDLHGATVEVVNQRAGGLAVTLDWTGPEGRVATGTGSGATNPGPAG